MKTYNYNYKPINLIAKAFDEADIRYHVEEHGPVEMLCARVPILGGPTTEVAFVTKDDDNDISVRIINLFNDIPDSLRLNALEVCNKINSQISCGKLYMDRMGNIDMEYSLSDAVTDECLGEVCKDIFFRFGSTLTHKYESIVKGLYLGQKEEENPRSRLKDIMKSLKLPTMEELEELEKRLMEDTEQSSDSPMFDFDEELEQAMTEVSALETDLGEMETAAEEEEAGDE